jgi:alanine dehydrogenase
LQDWSKPINFADLNLIGLMKLGIIREGKVPQDSRVPLNPQQCAALLELEPGLEIFVQPSDIRCYSDDEYRAAGINLREDLSDCKVLLGVKEVPIDQLMEEKTYFFFSHTIKAQPYNRGLLQEILKRQIRLIDWETLTNDKGQRLIAFGRWAGIVGAYNAFWTWSQNRGGEKLPRANELKDFEELKSVLANWEAPRDMRIALTGGGRVAGGAVEVLEAAGISRLSPEEFLKADHSEACFAQLDCPDLYVKEGQTEFDWADFFANPGEYSSLFEPYTRVANCFINAVYWDPAAPIFFSKEQMKQDEFSIKVIADITCDIEGSVPSTLYATTIADPVYSYDPQAEKAVDAFTPGLIDVMSIDNLPNELPRDASQAFGEQFLEQVWPELRKPEQSDVLHRATIARWGELNEPYSYLQSYVDELSQA